MFLSKSWKIGQFNLILKLTAHQLELVNHNFLSRTRVKLFAFQVKGMQKYDYINNVFN